MVPAFDILNIKAGNLDTQARAGLAVSKQETAVFRIVNVHLLRQEASETDYEQITETLK